MDKARKNIAHELLRQMVELKAKMNVLIQEDGQWKAADTAFDQYYLEIHKIFELEK